MVHVASTKITIPRFLIAFFAGETKPLTIVASALVNEGLSKGEVLQVLDGFAVGVGDPAGGAEVLASHTLLHLGIAQASLALRSTSTKVGVVEEEREQGTTGPRPASPEVSYISFICLLVHLFVIFRGVKCKMVSSSVAPCPTIPSPFLFWQIRINIIFPTIKNILNIYCLSGIFYMIIYNLVYNGLK